MEYKELVAVTYKIFPSFPPNSKLDTNSGTKSCPINSLFGLKHLIALPALVQIFPSLSLLKHQKKMV